MKPQTYDRRLALIATATLLALSWRAASLALPSELIDVPSELRFWMPLLGIVFLSAGVAVAVERDDSVALHFLLYCVCGAIHWGGAIGGAFETTFVSIYVATTYLGQASLLAMVLVIMRPLSRFVGVVLYAPVVALALLAPFATWIGRDQLTALLGVFLFGASLLALLAWLVFVRRAFQTELEPRARDAARWIAAALVSFTALAAMGRAGWLISSGTVSSEVYNLILAGIPITMSVAQARLPAVSNRRSTLLAAGSSDPREPRT